jgi:hypothetical protein
MPTRAAPRGCWRTREWPCPATCGEEERQQDDGGEADGGAQARDGDGDVPHDVGRRRVRGGDARRSLPKKKLATFSKKMSRPSVTIMWAECGASTMRWITTV